MELKEDYHMLTLRWISRRARVASVLTIILVLITVISCSSSQDSESEDPSQDMDDAGLAGSNDSEAEQAASAEQLWHVATGLDVSEEEVWQQRIEELCAAPIWIYNVSEPIVIEYVNADSRDMVDFNRDDVDRLSAAGALWSIAVENCPDEFPAEALERGPEDLIRIVGGTAISANVEGYDPGPLEWFEPTWFNMTGLPGPGAEIWEQRIQEMCETPMWEYEAADALAAKYIGEDSRNMQYIDYVDYLRYLGISENPPQALRLIAIQPGNCRDRFPEEALQPGAIWLQTEE